MKRRQLAVFAVAAALLAVAAGGALRAGQRQDSPPPGDSSMLRPSTPAPVPIISLSVKNADLVEVVRSLARIAGINVVIHPGVSGTVTAELTNVRWDHALAVILKINGLGMELDGRVVSVAPPSRLHATPPSRLHATPPSRSYATP